MFTVTGITGQVGGAVGKILLRKNKRVRAVVMPIVELEGPRRYSANDIAQAFSTALGRPVLTSAVPRDT